MLNLRALFTGSPVLPAASCEEMTLDVLSGIQMQCFRENMRAVLVKTHGASADHILDTVTMPMFLSLSYAERQARYNSSVLLLKRI